ncbi:ammonia-dependent NAD(+) synthetase [Gulosibacter molinativorax]|uniref:NH(3)-dependent NAD(+) synthetase n=1 Tax=Gulosibacter molinativorax TaxID=256821 RepID=A0ABT7C9D9_9MICO|nr:ammonia-dependent NAD(+) synthetase [Gulosibacter molinativorax]MDJ1371810.1 ammonia-dependent NAD(+) synthetase [Gulosibacter molinativorax]QUY60818.1 NH(3)-dependent NAD(+) synthetase [Gulosibacter molinativorax]
MTELQAEIIRALGVKPEISPADEIRSRVDFMKDYLCNAHAKGFVLGVSGGQDSTLAGRLAQLAVEELRAEGYEARFFAVRLPFGVQQDEADAQLALQFIQPDESVTVDIKPAVTGLDAGTNIEFSDYNRGNVKARMRMVAQYAIAGEHGLMVIGTDHAAEAVTGFYTKFGDGACDLTPLAGLNKGQGRQILQELAAPEQLYLKVPTADLLDGVPGRPDEVELGVTYEEIDTYLTGDTVSDEAASKIEGYYRRTQHKRELPVTPWDTWWR